MENKNSEKYISLAEASKISGYHQDYLGSLCRNGKLEAVKIGRNWVTTKSAVNGLKSSTDAGSSKSEQLVVRYSRTGSIDSINPTPKVPIKVPKKVSVQSFSSVNEVMLDYGMSDLPISITESQFYGKKDLRAGQPGHASLQSRMASNLKIGGEANSHSAARSSSVGEHAVLSPVIVEQLWSSFQKPKKQPIKIYAFITALSLCALLVIVPLLGNSLANSFFGQSKTSTISYDFGIRPRVAGATITNTEAIINNSLVGNIVTSEVGIGEIDFGKNLGYDKPSIQLTSENNQPMIVEVLSWKTDSQQGYTGVIVKSFDTTGRARQAIVHYLIIAQ